MGVVIPLGEWAILGWAESGGRFLGGDSKPNHHMHQIEDTGYGQNLATSQKIDLLRRRQVSLVSAAFSPRL